MNDCLGGIYLSSSSTPLVNKTSYATHVAWKKFETIDARRKQVFLMQHATADESQLLTLFLASQDEAENALAVKQNIKKDRRHYGNAD